MLKLRRTKDFQNLFEKKCSEAKKPMNKPPIDVKNRWNSTFLLLLYAVYYMDELDYVLSFFHVLTFQVTRNLKSAEIYRLTENEQKKIGMVLLILQIFYASTLFTSQSSQVSISYVQPRYKHILDILEDYVDLEEVKADSNYCEGINKCMQKVKKYYSLLDDASNIYAFSVSRNLMFYFNLINYHSSAPRSQICLF
jgi:hypothetical protein